MTELGATLERVAMLLDREKIPYMVIGGFASIVWGVPRSTRDVDVTVDVTRAGLDTLVAVVGELGRARVEDPVGFADRSRVLPARTHEGQAVDFVVATLPFELDAIVRARTVRVGATDVRVCSPEDLIVHKVVSERDRDLEDVIGVLRRQGRSLDLAGLDRMVEGLASDLGEPEIARRYRRAKRAAGIAGPG